LPTTEVVPCWAKDECGESASIKKAKNERRALLAVRLTNSPFCVKR
jgi:hypothetical protein